MKIELKHIAPYLPYKLKGVEEEYIVVMELQGISQYGFVLEDGEHDDISRFRPILRPLSDLTKEIEVNGEKFVVNEKMYDLFKLNPQWDGWENFGKIAVDFPYELWEKLFEWHFDVFGLIPQGLAIDINTL